MFNNLPKPKFPPPGVDPKTLEDSLKFSGPTLSGILQKAFFWFAVIFVGFMLFSQQRKGQEAAEATMPTIAPTYTSAPPTPAPTFTPSDTPTPTITPTGTVTIYPTIPPTRTPTPTAMNTPTEIPPGMVASWTPGAWMLTKFAATERGDQIDPLETPVEAQPTADAISFGN